jgi:hypothetical protein
MANQGQATDPDDSPEPDVFISFRFGEAHTEALALRQALEACGLVVFLSDVAAGGNLQVVIAKALDHCKLAVILASATYGHQTNSLFDTYSEMNFIVSQRKRYYLVRMIPPEDRWSEAHVTMAFPPSIMYKLWWPAVGTQPQTHAMPCHDSRSSLDLRLF